jgi:hypothetical protein
MNSCDFRFSCPKRFGRAGGRGRWLKHHVIRKTAYIDIESSAARGLLQRLAESAPAGPART